ncbi:MAG: HAD family phosphatase [Lachnospiraceae bacterium]|nr:HAD family phosphatase [Lachnospiraceae bacterium]
MTQIKPDVSTVIFDMDGTLIDTEKYYRIFWKKALACYGYSMTDEQALSMRSLGRPFAPIRLREMFGDELDYNAVRDCRRKMMEECLEKEGIGLKPGALELLKWLKDKGITTAVATATDPERTIKYLKRTGLAQFMDRVVSAAMVKEGKPSPDIYLLACAQLNVKPEDTFAVEDSPNGILSAFRAGCNVVMVPDQTQPDEELQKLLYACVPVLTDIKGLFAC